MAEAEGPDDAEQIVSRSNKMWWGTLPRDLQFYQDFANPVIFAKLYLLPNEHRKTLHPITELVDDGEARVCVLILPPKLHGTSVDRRSTRNLLRIAKANEAPRLPTHPWSQINIKEMVDKGLIYSRTLKEGETDDIDIVESNVGIYLAGTTHYWYKVQPYDGLSYYASPYREPVHGIINNPPMIVPYAAIHYGCVTIVEDPDERFKQVHANLSGQGAASLGGNKYSRKHKSTKRAKKQNSRRNRNRRRYRTRNRR